MARTLLEPHPSICRAVERLAVRTLAASALIALVVLSCGRPACADPVWTLRAPEASRSQHSAVEDSIGNRMIMFGGWSGRQALAELWVLELAGTPAWHPWVVPGGPSPRYGHTAICDPLTRRMIVFGGTDGTTRFDEVWTVNLTGAPQWQQLHPAAGPEARSGATAVYDAANRRMVVYGGSGAAGTLADIWAMSLDGAPAWTAIVPSGTPPSDRAGHSAIYDPVRDRMIVFGGTGSAVENDVWALSLAGSPAWTQLVGPGSTGRPRYRFGHGAVYDPVADRMLILPGTDGGTWRRDMWQLPLGGTPTWSSMGGTPYMFVRDYASAFDPRARRIVLYAGLMESPVNDAWQCALDSGPVWTALASPVGPPQGRYMSDVLLDSAQRRMVLLGGTPSGGLAVDNSVWSLSLDGEHTWRFEASVPTATTRLAEQAFVTDPASRRIVGVGGYPPRDVSMSSLDTLGTWRNYPLAPGPTARKFTSAVFDPTRNRVVMFGGQDMVLEYGPKLGDTWALSLGEPLTWTPIDGGSGPSPRQEHAAIYDPLGDRMLVFGGITTGNAVSNELWSLAFAGTPTWTRLDLPDPPPGMYTHHAIYDPVGQRMLVLGSIYSQSVWALSLTGTPAWTLLSDHSANFTGHGNRMLVDPALDRLLVYGGNNSGEVWSLPIGGTCVSPVVTPAAGGIAAQQGGRVTLAASATGDAPLSVAWRHDGLALTDGPNVAGALTPSLTLLHAQSADAGGYSATFTNGCGTAVSSSATVSVSCAGPPASPPSGMQSWWDMETPAPGGLADLAHLASGQNRAQLVGSAQQVPGLAGGALRCSGASDGLRVPATGTNFSMGANGYGFEAWAWLFPGSSGATERVILSRAGSTASRGFRFYVRGGHLGFATEGFAPLIVAETPDSVVSASVWHQLAVRVVPSSGQGALYLDGAAVLAFNAAGATITATGDLYAGRLETMPGAEGFNGDLDEVFVFSPGTAAAELASIQSRFAAACAGARREFARTPVTMLLPRTTGRVSFCAELDNFSPAERSYRWAVSTLVPQAGCPGPGPITFSPASGTVVVPAGQRLLVPIVARSTASTLGTWCYRFAAANAATLDTIQASGQISTTTRPLGVAPVPLCAVSQAPNRVQRFATAARAAHAQAVSVQSVTYRVYNDSTVALPFDYLASAVHPDGSPSLRVAIDGGAPGDPASGSVMVGAADSLDLVLAVALSDPDPMVDEQIVLSSALGAPGDPAPVAAAYVSAAEDSLVNTLGVPGPTHASVPAGRAHPNPMSVRTRIDFEFPERGELDAGVFDLGGRRVRLLAHAIFGPGPLFLEWDGRDGAGVRCAPGMYFVRASLAGRHRSTPILLLR